MNLKLSFWVFLTIAFTAASLWGGDADPETPLLIKDQPLTPDDLYEIALLHNPDHQKNIQNASLSGSNLRSAWGTIMPSLDVSFQISQSEYYNPTYVQPDGSVATYPITQEGYETVYDTLGSEGYIFQGFDPNSPTSITYDIPEGKSSGSYAWIGLRETLNLGGSQYFTIKNAGIQNRINDLMVASSELNLRYNVHQKYYIVLAYKWLFDLSKHLQDQKNEQLRLAQARYEVGSVTELDVLQAEIDVGSQDNAVIEAEKNLKLAREDLNAVLGIDLDSDYQLIEEYTLFALEFDLDALMRESVMFRPDYIMYREQERYNKNSVHISRSAFLPDLSLALSHTRSQNSGKDLDFTANPRNRNTSGSLTLSWNLFSGFSDEEQFQQSRVAHRNARHDRKKQEQLIYQEVRQAYYTLMQTYEQYRVNEKNRELASRQLELEQERYRLGATSQLNLRTAQVTYEQAEVDYISSIFNFWSNLAGLERAVGKKLQ
jgi:outer membrane protein TolC